MGSKAMLKVLHLACYAVLGNSLQLLNAGGGHGAKCDHASHKHCPGKSRCARGELRKMDLGVCTYDAVDA